MNITERASDHDLRLTIRNLLATGTLFPAPNRIWVGPGQGRTCMVCGTTISSQEVENEMVMGPVTIWAHLPCYRLWREESDQLAAPSATDMEDYVITLRRMVGTRLKSGTLLALRDNRSRPSRGVNAVCAVCDQAIFAEELSQEPLENRRRDHAHLLCHRAWLEESKVAWRGSSRHASV